jgi:hypothetical protein
VQPPRGNARWQAQGTYHTPFYYPDSANPSKPAGWKVYLHAKEITGAAEGFRPEACIPKGAFFDFDVDYENLSGEEFAVLRFALTLQHKCPDPPVSLAHKLGYGKGIGMGSCRVSAKIVPVRTRRFFGEEPTPESDCGCEIHRYLDLPGFAQLREFLAWDSRPDQLLFPDYGWFSGPGSIADYERSMNQQAAPPPAPEPVSEPDLKVKLPKRVDVRITGVKRGAIRFETVDEFEGVRYTGTAGNSLYGAETGRICDLKVRQVDARTKTLSGSLQWKP